MSKIIGLANTCRECPHRRYESGGVYRCEKVGVDLDASCAIPDWCPLPNYPAQSAQTAHAHAIDTSPEGWKLVPVEPTEEMLYEAQDQHIMPARMKRLWKLLLSAAPSTKEKTE